MLTYSLLTDVILYKVFKKMTRTRELELIKPSNFEGLLFGKWKELYVESEREIAKNSYNF